MIFGQFNNINALYFEFFILFLVFLLLLCTILLKALYIIEWKIPSKCLFLNRIFYNELGVYPEKSEGKKVGFSTSLNLKIPKPEKTTAWEPLLVVSQNDGLLQRENSELVPQVFMP
jgi:hypothetical protein